MGTATAMGTAVMVMAITRTVTAITTYEAPSPDGADLVIDTGAPGHSVQRSVDLLMAHLTKEGHMVAPPPASK
jgi:hypothetical protein